MSACSAEGFLDVVEARKIYGLSFQERGKPSNLEAALREAGVASIKMPVSNTDFADLINAYETCIDAYPGLLGETYAEEDGRYGAEVGHVRKERRIDEPTGVQLEDAKSLIHFNERASARWREQFAGAPQQFRELLDKGYEVQRALVSLACEQFVQLETTHPKIAAAHFPRRHGQLWSDTFMRVISYDSYLASDVEGAVAKPHFDIGGATIQAFADAPGFWGAKSYRDERVFYESDRGYAQFFMGLGYKKLYGSETKIHPLYHGVERIIPEGVKVVPRRHAVILFIDGPRIDYGVTKQDTLPELANIPA